MRNFRKSFITNTANRSKQTLKAMGCVLHETATPGATAESEVVSFNTHDYEASAHGFIDWKEDIQSIEWDRKGWHCCEPANSKFLGIEMCRPYDNDPDRIVKMKTVYNATVDAFARLFFYVLKIDTITKDNLMSHDEVRLKWHNTCHTDPTSYLKEIGKNMDMFRSEVQSKLNTLK